MHIIKYYIYFLRIIFIFYVNLLHTHVIIPTLQKNTLNIYHIWLEIHITI